MFGIKSVCSETLRQPEWDPPSSETEDPSEDHTAGRGRLFTAGVDTE